MPKKSSGMQKIQFLNRISPQKINKPKTPFYFTVIESDRIWIFHKMAEGQSQTFDYKSWPLSKPQVEQFENVIIWVILALKFQ